jgi:hypothetical protein
VLFTALVYAPLVMPEVISGLSLLLLFVALNAERGFWTVTIAHTTLTMCFVATVVQSRLSALDHSLEEAAMDLGCNPLRAFLLATLPLIIPSIVAGWMLAFTLSLDDVVIEGRNPGDRPFMRVGRVTKHWNRNCVAIGLSQGGQEVRELVRGKPIFRRIDRGLAEN